jgi:hypothetical protein
MCDAESAPKRSRSDVTKSDADSVVEEEVVTEEEEEVTEGKACMESYGCYLLDPAMRKHAHKDFLNLNRDNTDPEKPEIGEYVTCSSFQTS